LLATRTPSGVAAYKIAAAMAIERLMRNVVAADVEIVAEPHFCLRRGNDQTSHE